MAWIVNVENLEFDELIPLLKENVHIKEACDYTEDQKARTLNHLRTLFNKLKNGEVGYHFLIGIGLVQCLEQLERVLLITDGYEHDFDIVPITKEKLKKFLLGLKGMNYA